MIPWAARLSSLALSAALSALLSGCGKESPTSSVSKSARPSNSGAAVGASPSSGALKPSDLPAGASLGRCAKVDKSTFEGSLKADSCFRLNPDAFKFKNYPDRGNLTVDEMVEVFGPGVCSKFTPEAATCKAGYCNKSCFLTGVAGRYLELYNELMKGGHCDGMAALSQLIHAGALGKVDGKPTSALEITSNGQLQRRIARWWTTQFNIQELNKFEDKEPSEAFGFLDELWSRRSMATLWIHFSDGSAHALTPYALTSMPDGKLRVYVYDSNTPGKPGYVEVSPAERAWKYDPGGQKPKAGSADSPEGLRAMRFVANEARQGEPYCWFCTASRGSVEQHLVSLVGETNVRVVNGEALYEKVKGLWAPKDAKLVHTYAAPGDRALPAVLLEPKAAYQVELAGPTPAEGGRLVASSSHGGTLSVEGIRPDPGKSSVAKISPGASELEYTAAGEEKLTLYVIRPRSTEDYELRLTAAVGAGQAIRVKDDEPSGSVTLALDGPQAPRELSIAIERRAQSGVKTATISPMIEGASVEYGIELNPSLTDLKVDVKDVKTHSVLSSGTWRALPPLGPGVWYRLQTEGGGNGRCLEGNEAGSPTHNGAAFMNGCNGASGQQWEVIPVPSRSSYWLRTKFQGPDRCLDGNNPGSNLHDGGAYMNTCDESAKTQQWSIISDRSGHLRLQATSLGSAMCLGEDDSDVKSHKGASYLAACQDAPSRKWNIVP